jgi:hypothetical protein
MRYAGRLLKLLMKVASEYSVGVMSTFRTSSCACAFSTISFKTPTHCRKEPSMAIAKELRRSTHLIKEACKLVCPLKFTLAMDVIDDTGWDDKQVNA